MSVAAPSPAAGTFRHEAFFYAGQGDFLAGTVPFIRGGVEAGEPVLIVESAAKTEMLRDVLGREADAVQFADMSDVGANPARIIPAWQDFVAQHGRERRRLRGIGEPIWAERGAAELVECQRHESLLNVAFANAQAWWLMCPYDLLNLEPAVIQEARRSHPVLRMGGLELESPEYAAEAMATAGLNVPLPEPPGSAPRMIFEATHSLSAMRAFISRQAASAGLGSVRSAELILAANEVAANSLRHGGGSGTVLVWPENDMVLCEIRDRGRLDVPLAGRERPGADVAAPRGMWLATQLCDLIQVRRSPDGTAVRLHVRR